MDISADLTELARTPVTVVCAGAKSVSCCACASIDKSCSHIVMHGLHCGIHKDLNNCIYYIVQGT